MSDRLFTSRSGGGGGGGSSPLATTTVPGILLRHAVGTGAAVTTDDFNPAAIPAANIASVNPTTLTGTGTVPPAALNIIGTTDRVTVTVSGTQLVLSAPQNLGTTSTPSFSSVSATGITGALAIGNATADTNATTVSAALASIVSKLNQSGTAGYTTLQLNALQTSVGSGAKLLFDAQADSVSVFSISNVGRATIAPAAATSLTPPEALRITGAAHTGLTNAEALDVNYQLNRTVTFLGGTATSFAQQRAIIVSPPVYDAATAGLTVTLATTLSILGPPSPNSANVALTVPVALHIAAGTLLHGGATTNVAPPTVTTRGLYSMGGPFDGVTTGFFVGSASGTAIALNMASGYAGRFIEAQVAGVNKFRVDAFGFLRTVHMGSIITPAALGVSVNTTNAGVGATGSATGTDVHGTVSLTTGTTPWAAGDQMTVTFATAYSAAPIVILTPTNASGASTLNSRNWYVTSTPTTFTINFGVGAASVINPTWNYVVHGI